MVVAPDALLTEIKALEQSGTSVRDRLFVSQACPIILASHIALDRAREAYQGATAIGTTCRGIGPAYEDKIARRALKIGDLLDVERLEAKLTEVVEYHNFLLTHYYHQSAVDPSVVLAQALEWAKELGPMIQDTTTSLHTHRENGDVILFEGAQGVYLDIDHGTYPYVTSSNTCVGSVVNGAGFGPKYLDYILGITKAYTTRVGGGPFPTELHDDIGKTLSQRGNEVGATTGRARRCGWFDAVLLKRAIELNSITGLCLTKLDVLDGLSIIKVAVAYSDANGKILTRPGQSADDYVGLQPIYEELPGWVESTADVKVMSDLPANALAYIQYLEKLLGIPIDIVSTGPERDSTIIKRDPLGR